jgi:hypothetical protein
MACVARFSEFCAAAAAAALDWVAVAAAAAGAAASTAPPPLAPLSGRANPSWLAIKARMLTPASNVARRSVSRQEVS